MYARTVPGPEKQPYLGEFLDKPDIPLDIWVAPRDQSAHSVQIILAACLLWDNLNMYAWNKSMWERQHTEKSVCPSCFFFLIGLIP